MIYIFDYDNKAYAKVLLTQMHYQKMFMSLATETKLLNTTFYE